MRPPTLLLTAVLAALAIGAAPTPIAFEVLTVNGDRLPEEGPPRLTAALNQAELQAMFADLDPGVEVPEVDFGRWVVVGFDFLRGQCVPEVAQPTVEADVVTIPLLLNLDPLAPCPSVVVRPAYVVALNRAALPGGEVTVRVVEAPSAELVRGTVQLPGGLPETGPPGGLLAAAAGCIVAGFGLLQRRRDRLDRGRR